MLVKTLEGCYIGETSYTYTADLLTRFEHYVKALDDEDMELSFSRTADEQVELAYNNTCTCGREFNNLVESCTYKLPQFNVMLQYAVPTSWYQSFVFL